MLHLEGLVLLQPLSGDDVNDIMECEGGVVEFYAETVATAEVLMNTAVIHPPGTLQKFEGVREFEGIADELLLTEHPLHIFLLVFEQCDVIEIRFVTDVHTDGLLGSVVHRLV